MINIHVDVDNLWMYEHEYGIKILNDREYIYTQSLPLFLKLLKKTRTKATFMIIGKDLQLRACRAFCRSAIAAGHEVANHTWSHKVNFSSLPASQKKQEILKAHQEIKKVCGKAPVGFRGPGYYLDQEIVGILEELGYRYDSSILPGYGTLLMSLHAFLKGGENKKKAFGNIRHVFSSETPYALGNLAKNPLVELPISILPILKLPIHTTFAYSFGETYRQLILKHLRAKPKYLVYLFHAIDFADLPQRDATFPVIPLRYSFEERINLVTDLLEHLAKANRGPILTSREVMDSRSFQKYL